MAASRWSRSPRRVPTRTAGDDQERRLSVAMIVAGRRTHTVGLGGVRAGNGTTPRRHADELLSYRTRPHRLPRRRDRSDPADVIGCRFRSHSRAASPSRSAGPPMPAVSTPPAGLVSVVRDVLPVIRCAVPDADVPFAVAGLLPDSGCSGSKVLKFRIISSDKSADFQLGRGVRPSSAVRSSIG